MQKEDEHAEKQVVFVEQPEVIEVERAGREEVDEGVGSVVLCIYVLPASCILISLTSTFRAFELFMYACSKLS